MDDKRLIDGLADRLDPPDAESRRKPRKLREREPAREPLLDRWLYGCNQAAHSNLTPVIEAPAINALSVAVLLAGEEIAAAVREVADAIREQDERAR